MLAYPNVDWSVDRLKSGGWAMGDLCLERADGRVWIVTGQRGKHWIIAQAQCQAAAWWLAARQAKVLELDRKRRPSRATKRNVGAPVLGNETLRIESAVDRQDVDKS